MKKTILIALLMIFSLGASTAFAGKPDLKSTEPAAKESKLSEEEVSRLIKRVEEIRDMDKSEMTLKKKRDLKKKTKEIKAKFKKNLNGYFYISGGTLLIILLIILIL
jgi:hypothetical protein